MTVTPIRDKWPGTMTDRERFVNQLHYRPADRTVNMEFGYWKENFQAWPMFVENGITNNAQADRFFHFDSGGTVGGKVWMNPPFEYQVIEETEDKQIIRNHEGLLAEVPKDGHETIPHFINSSINSPADWEKVKAERFRLDDPDRQVDVDALVARHRRDRDYPLTVNVGSMIGKIRDMLTVEGLSYAMFDYPDMVEDMVETCCRLVESFLDQVLGKLDFDSAHGWEDIAFRGGPLITLDFFHDIVVPRYKRISEKLRAAGVDIWAIDCDGDIRPMIPGFLEGGVNVMFPFEVHCSGHPGEMLDKYGRDLRIMGGVDKMVLARTPGEIRAYVESLVPYVRRGGFIPFCDHRCPPNVSQENYLYYLDVKQELLAETPIEP
jgi:uroporphyrinogen decarboxylase